MEPRRVAPVLALLALFLGCKASHEPVPQTQPSVSSAHTHAYGYGSTTMLHHEVLGIALRDAIAKADLRDARRTALELSEIYVAEVPSPDYGERLHTMRVAASHVATAQDLPQAARAFGGLVQTCSDCHARLGGPTRLEVSSPEPSATTGVQARMTRHAWAVNELWNGLIGNSEAPWRAGAAVLADPALKPTDLVSGKTSVPELDRLALSVESLGQRARLATDTEVRAAIFGELLETCGGCHERMRDRSNTRFRDRLKE